MHISAFISSHGYGHASRCSAVLEALYVLLDDLRLTIYSKVPSSFFNQSITAPHEIVPLETDVGLVQNSPMISDLDKTLQELRKFYPLSSALLDKLDKEITKNTTDAIICDISPLGIRAGLNSGIPVFLIENFTWDWIYKDYTESHPEFEYYSELLNKIFTDPNVNRIQAQPAAATEKPSVSVPPISRAPRLSPEHIKNRLNIYTADKLVLITMGGIPHNYQLLDKLKQYQELTFLLPGTSDHTIQEDNCILIPHQSEFYHPDLVNASDLVVGKLGYSTLAEVYATGTDFLYIKRPGFKEMKILENFAHKYLNATSINDNLFEDDTWISQVQDLINNSTTINKPSETEGALQAAQFIIKNYW